MLMCNGTAKRQGSGPRAAASRLAAEVSYAHCGGSPDPGRLPRRPAELAFRIQRRHVAPCRWQSAFRPSRCHPVPAISRPAEQGETVHLSLRAADRQRVRWRNSLTVAVLAFVALLAAAGCSSPAIHTPPKPPPSQTPSQSPPASAGCTTSAVKGTCGPYDNYGQITETTSSTYAGQDVWNPIPGWAQTLHATDPGDWYVTANMPAGNTAVVSYPSVGANYGQTSDTPTPLSNYSSIYSSFSENMNARSQTSAWAAYDIWLGRSASSSYTNEVMIQHDFANNGACTVLATAAFGGSGGVPVQDWNLCQFGSELVWKLRTNEQTGTVDILSMLNWLVNHRYLAHDSGLWSIGYGFEICSTGGADEKFQVNGFSLTPTVSGGSTSPSSS